MRKLYQLKAYTIAEVLVIVGIVTALILAAVAIYAPQSKKARDAKRKTDLYAIAKILEEYEKDNEIYPAALTQCAVTTSGSPLASYATSIPCDPQTDTNYVYEIGPNATSRTWFRVYSLLENEGDVDVAQVGCTGGCGPGGGYNYFVSSPNAPPLATAGVYPTLFPTPTGGPTATTGPTATPGGPTSTSTPVPTTPPTAPPTAPPTVPPTATPSPTPIPGGNLLANPGFESGSANWTGVSGLASITNLVFHSGILALETIQPASGSVMVYQSVNVTEGQSYFASGWIRTNAVTSGGTQININWRNASGQGFEQANVGTQFGTVNWTYYSTNVTAPVGAVAARFTVGIIRGTGGVGYFDDLVFRQN